MKYLVQVEDIEVRVAKVSQGRLIDLDIERDNRLLGNIYKGRIANVLPGMDAAFIDLGTDAQRIDLRRRSACQRRIRIACTRRIYRSASQS
jgi:Ribonuclease G/E